MDERQRDMFCCKCGMETRITIESLRDKFKSEGNVSVKWLDFCCPKCSAEERELMAEEDQPKDDLPF